MPVGPKLRQPKNGRGRAGCDRYQPVKSQVPGGENTSQSRDTAAIEFAGQNRHQMAAVPRDASRQHVTGPSILKSNTFIESAGNLGRIAIRKPQKTVENHVQTSAAAGEFLHRG
jgi:hypothetical protein